MLKESSKTRRDRASGKIVLLDFTKRGRAKRFVFLAILVNSPTRMSKQVANHVLSDGTRKNQDKMVVMTARQDARQDKQEPRDVNCAVPESTKITMGTTTT